MVATNERVMRPRAKPELLLEWVLFASRWILAPLYLSMVSMLAAIFVVFLRQLISQLPNLWTMESEQVILLTLSFIDLSFNRQSAVDCHLCRIRKLRLEDPCWRW